MSRYPCRSTRSLLTRFPLRARPWPPRPSRPRPSSPRHASRALDHVRLRVTHPLIYSPPPSTSCCSSPPPYCCSCSSCWSWAGSSPAPAAARQRGYRDKKGGEQRREPAPHGPPHVRRPFARPPGLGRANGACVWIQSPRKAGRETSAGHAPCRPKAQRQRPPRSVDDRGRGPEGPRAGSDGNKRSSSCFSRRAGRKQ